MHLFQHHPAAVLGAALIGFTGTIPANAVTTVSTTSTLTAASTTGTLTTTTTARKAPCHDDGTPLAAPARPAATSAERAATTPAPSSAKITVWLAGDSTMANAKTCPIGWGARFQTSFTSAVTVVNNAVAGRSIQTWLYDPNVTSTKGPNGECVIKPNTYSSRWQAMLDASTGMKAGDYLFVQFGINDGSTTCNRHVGSARYVELLGMMAQAAAARGVHAVFLTPVAAITCSGSSAIGNRGFLTETTTAAAANKVPVIDLHKLSVALYNTLRLCPNNGDYTKGPVGAFFCNDHTHFESEGAQQIAGLVAGALRSQGIGLAAYLR